MKKYGLLILSTLIVMGLNGMYEPTGSDTNTYIRIHGYSIPVYSDLIKKEKLIERMKPDFSREQLKRSINQLKQKVFLNGMNMVGAAVLSKTTKIPQERESMKDLSSVLGKKQIILIQECMTKHREYRDHFKD